MGENLKIWENVRDQSLVWLENDPWLCASFLGMVVSAGYVILMLVTRLGDIKRGVQSLVLSALLHSLLFVFWGTVMVSAIKPGAPDVTAEIPVRQVVFDDSEAESGSDPDQGQVWERFPESDAGDMARTDAEPAEMTPLESPERTPDKLENALTNLPDLPQAADEQGATPETVRSELKQKPSAVDQEIEIAEETAEARPETGEKETAMILPTRERPGIEETKIERTTRKGTDAKAIVQPVPQASTSEDPVQPAAPLRRGPAQETVRRQNGPAPTDMPVEEPGVEGGTSTAENGSGSPSAMRFSRVGQGRKPAGRELASTFSRTQPGAVDAPSGRTGSEAFMPTRTGGRDFAPAGAPRPALSRPDLASIPQRGTAQVPETYRLRNLPRRQKIALSLGATQESERAVELSLKWLAMHQDPEGYWDADGFTKHCPGGDQCVGHAGLANKIDDGPDRHQAGKEADTGLTALVILAFLGAGHTHEEGEYADQIDRALRWLIRQQGSDGMLGGQAGRYDRMYCHGMATYALGEAIGMSNDPVGDPQLRDALARAAQFIIDVQNPDDGGWRYLPGQKGDMSMFGWQLMGLKSAEIAGLEIPQITRTNMIRFLKANAVGSNNGLAAYRLGERPKPSMTAEALFSRQMLGTKRTNGATQEAIEYLMQHLPKQSEPDLYYWYYGTLAMYQYGGEPWREWNTRLRPILVSGQRQSGHAAGSWDPRDPWGQYGGRLYSTALSTLCLEVYYRFLPLYRLGGKPPTAP